MTTFQIVFDNPTSMYCCGQSVTGNVVLVLSESMKMRKILLHFQGKANVHWSSDRRNKKHNRNQNIYDNYYDNKLIPLGEENNDENIVLQAGSYQFPFNFVIPANAPTSFEGKNGSVRHIITATIDRPLKIDNECQVAFTVVNHVNLNMELPALRDPYEIENELNVSGCFTSGTVLARFGINRRCFVPGETMLCSYSVENRANKPIKWTSITLIQRVEYKCHRDVGRPTIRTIQVAEAFNNSPIQSGQSNEWKDVAITIPAIIPSRLDGCAIINVNYLVEFYSSLRRGMETEIVIGTIPLAGNDTSSVVTAQSMPQAEQAPAGQSQTPVTNPSSGHQITYAPCVNGQVSTGAARMMKAPMHPMFGRGII